MISIRMVNSMAQTDLQELAFLLELLDHLRDFNTSIRHIILEDTLTALHNRIKVFEKVKQS